MRARVAQQKARLQGASAQAGATASDRNAERGLSARPPEGQATGAGVHLV